MATMCHRPIANPVPVGHRGRGLAVLPPLAEGGRRAYTHSQTELTAEATKEPERTDAPQRLDVL